MWDPLGGSFSRKLLETEVKNRNNIHSGKQMPWGRKSDYSIPWQFKDVQDI